MSKNAFLARISQDSYKNVLLARFLQVNVVLVTFLQVNIFLSRDLQESCSKKSIIWKNPASTVFLARILQKYSRIMHYLPRFCQILPKILQEVYFPSTRGYIDFKRYGSFDLSFEFVSWNMKNLFVSTQIAVGNF